MWSQTSAHAAEKDKVASGKKKASLAQLLKYRCGMAGIDKKVDGKEPGLLLVISKLTRPNEVSPQAFTKWYENVHIPDILKTSGMKEASRWESTNPADERPYLALYPLRDLGFLQTDEFKGEPCADPSSAKPLLKQCCSHSSPFGPTSRFSSHFRLCGFRHSVLQACSVI